MSRLQEYREKYEDRTAEFRISVISRVCSRCDHFDIENPVARLCLAFPKGIPLEIWKGENDHTTEYPGDGGIRFETLKPNKSFEAFKAKHSKSDFKGEK